MYQAINDALNGQEPRQISVSVVSLSGVDTYTAKEGISVESFKASHGLQGCKIVDTDGNVLMNSDTLSNDIELFISTPKKNG